MYCWYCQSKLMWLADAKYSDMYAEGEGVVTFLKCSNEDCGAEVEFSRRDDKENIDKEKVNEY